MQDQIMNSLPRRFVLMGLTFFCGILPLLFAAVTFYTARKRIALSSTLKRTSLVPIAFLIPGNALIIVD